MGHLRLQTLALVGTSHRLVGFDRLGALVLAPGVKAAREALRDALGADELLYLATCNRVECYVTLSAPASDAELRGRFRDHFRGVGTELADGELTACQGAAAVRHAFSVAASLNSLVVGETEIAGQLRRALQEALEWEVAGPCLRDLHDRAQACAREIRAKTGVGAMSTSVGTLAVRKILRYFSEQGPRVSVLLGVGTMTAKAARALEKFPGERVFVNRTLERAQELADRFGGRAMALGEFLERPPERIDLLMTATSAPEVVIPAELLTPHLRRRDLAADGPIVVCDLGVPRDVDPRLDGHPALRLVSMREIEQLARLKLEKLAGEVGRAQELLEQAVGKVSRESRFATLAATSTQAMLARQLPHVSQGDQEVILRFVQQLASRMARQPQRAS